MKCQYCGNLAHNPICHRCENKIFVAAHAEGWKIVDGVVMKPCPVEGCGLGFCNSEYENAPRLFCGTCNFNGKSKHPGLIPAGTADGKEQP